MATVSGMDTTPQLPPRQPTLPARPSEASPVAGPVHTTEYERALDESSDSIEMVDEVKEDHPTESHALADADHDLKGAAQIDHDDTEAKDLGWSKPSEEVPSPLVGGLPNEELWTLIRRFNKQMYHVKALDEPPLGGLDLNIADEEEFSPDKLRANFERLYMTVIIGIVGFGKHIARIRSWREKNRTVAFLSIYSAAWLLDFLVPVIIAFCMILVYFPQARTYCFPPAPIALIDGKTGSVKKPAAGVLGSDDSITGAPEKHQGEAVEQEATNFVNGFASIALSSATGKHPAGDPHDESDSKLESGTPDPTNLAVVASDAQTSVSGGQSNAEHDKTKEPMSAAMWSKTRPIMHGVADVADAWERFGNALSPTAPFHKHKPRIKLTACLAPLLLISIFTTSKNFMKANSFIFGFAFFGDPVICRGLSYLNKKFPEWQKLLEIRNTLLKGVPTNAQLTITLLRIGEKNKAPLPPPPYSGPPPPNEAHATAGQDLEHLGKFKSYINYARSQGRSLIFGEGAHEDEIAAAVNADNSATATGADTGPPKKKHGRRLLAFVKGTTKGGVETMLGTDRLKAAAGAPHAKNRLGVLRSGPADPSGPVDFPARYKGQKGRIYITTTATSPAVSWTTEKEDIDPVFTIAVADIKEIKKVGGFGWKSKLIIGWATNREIADGLVIIDKEGNSKQLTAIALREELFNRLIAVGNQMWESW